jgi:hypothetical protein
VGWHFTTRGVPYGPELGIHPTTTVTNWSLAGADTVELNPDRGWILRFSDTQAVITSPNFRIDALVAPFVRLKAAFRGLSPSTRLRFEWQTDADPDFTGERRVEFSWTAADGAVADLDLPLRGQPTGARLIRFRLHADGLVPGSELTLLRLFSAIDTRHNINNAAYLQACDDYVRWTGDLDFLRRNLPRMRLALAWALHEFQIAENGVVRTTWIGHDGRSGHSLSPEGRRSLLRGVGVGNNYWDLLPFGGEDALATIYYFDVLRRMAAMERHIERHPEWNLPGGPLRFEPAELLELAREVQAAGNERFWNPTTGRFVGWRDLEGRSHDYGFTFVNNEAIYYAFAYPDHAQAIRDWIDGRRLVAGDTSTGADIYHWRFGPRATTRRNVETYLWAWSDPASIPWGGQVQDGGAVLGFSFHDLMARLEVAGPDDAWNRLREVITWFGEIQDAGGYRAYYSDPARGTLQGGGTAGGLGLDHEFFESAMVPQVMLYGFLGFRPRLDGGLIVPRLPAAWPSLTVRNVRLHDLDLDITATAKSLRIQVRGEPQRPLLIFLPGREGPPVPLRSGLIEIDL